MRGLIPAHLMTRVEDRTGLRMAEMVDIFCGPSSGAILNAGLNVPREDSPEKPKFRARHMVKFYEREGISIFPRDRFRSFRGLIHDFNNRTMKINQLRSLFRQGHYAQANLHKALMDLYGQTRLSETVSNLVIPIYNIDGEQLEVTEEADETGESPVHTQNNIIDQGGYALWLKSMQKSGLRKQSVPDVSLLDSILATTAAPTYFPCHHFNVSYPETGRNIEYTGIDGSIFDNPCISYHGAIRQHLPKNVRFIMIIFGTGNTHRSFKKEDWNKFGGLGIVDPVNDLPLINILLHASETALIDSFSQELGDNLFIFNKSMLEGHGQPGRPNEQLDDASEENIAAMHTFADEIYEENRSAFDTICDLLVHNYEQRLENDSLFTHITGRIKDLF